MSQTLLIELLTEELPPKSLGALSDVFANEIAAGLKAQAFTAENSVVTAYASPRRLAVSISNVVALQPQRTVERKGPAVASGLDANGQPTPALAGFMRSCGVSDVAQLTKVQDAKAEYYAYRAEKAGEPLAQHLSAIVAAALKKLPVAKLMRWGEREVEFVRPVHGLMMLHGNEIVAGEVLGLTSGRTTRGHRFMGAGNLTIQSADDYARVLEADGFVVAGFADRRERIRAGLAAAAGDAQVMWDDALLNEVTALVEYPAVYQGEFSADFLAVPQECLILSMKQHQKYFPLADANGKLLPRFLVVSNLKLADAGAVIHGNERVLRARLSDARFFFEQDKKQRLDARVPRLADVVYHNKLGSQLQRVERLQKLAGEIARRLGGDGAKAERAAYLMKADLLTDMVGEFPELQGLMGRYYAQHDGEAVEVAAAIEAHYHPRFAGDSLPEGPIGTAVALADKLDTLVGIYGIGLIPTGDKDPFALRRHALGVLRIIVEGGLPLDLLQLLEFARSLFPAGVVAESVAQDLHGFMLDRLRGLLRDSGFDAGEIEAVLTFRPTRLDDVLPRLQAVQAFRRLPEAEALAAANKRIQNILKKAEGSVSTSVDAGRLVEEAEVNLFNALQSVAPTVAQLAGERAYEQALCELAALKQPVDSFFDGVMVMAEDAAVRNNRLALLASLGGLMNQVADIACLAK